MPTPDTTIDINRGDVVGEPLVLRTNEPLRPLRVLLVRDPRDDPGTGTTFPTTMKDWTYDHPDESMIQAELVIAAGTRVFIDSAGIHITQIEPPPGPHFARRTSLVHRGSP